MNSDILDKLIELKKDANHIYTYQLVKAFINFDKNSNDIVNELIKNKIIERFIDEKLDMCYFNTLKLDRLIKLKNLSD